MRWARGKEQVGWEGVVDEPPFFQGPGGKEQNSKKCCLLYFLLEVCFSFFFFCLGRISLTWGGIFQVDDCDGPRPG